MFLMIRQHILLFLAAFISPLFPPVIMPFIYSLLGILLVQEADPRTLSFVTVIASTLSCIVTWLAWIPITASLQKFKNEKSNTFIGKIERKISNYLSTTTWINKYTKRIESYANKKHGKIMFGFIVIFLLQSAVPDIIAIKMLQKRVSFWYFIVTAFLWKIILYIPIIFIWMSAISFIKLKLWW